MAKTYRIDLQVNNSQAEASARRSVATLGQVDKAAEKTAATLERAAAREAAAYDRNALRAQRAADRAADAAVKAAERSARQKQVLEDRLVAREASRMIASERAAQKTADSAVKAAERSARQKQAIEDRLIARENSRMIASERAAQRAADAAVRAKERESRQIQAIREREDRSFRALQDRRNREYDRGVNGGDGGAGIGDGLSAFANKAAGVAGVVYGIVGAFNEVNNKILESTNLVTEYQENLRELAALKGAPGKTATTMAEDIGFRSRTLQTAAESGAFQLAALGVGESSIDNEAGQRLISKGDFARALEFGGAFQAAEGGDAATHGRLIGMIPQMIGRRTDATEVIRKEAQYYNIMKPGGFSFSSGAGQFGRLAPLITTGLYKDTEAMALLSAFSTTNPEGAGENVQQFTRGTVGSLGRMRGVSVEGAEKIGPYLKKLGATNQMSPIEIGTLISGDLDRFEAGEKAAGRDANVMDYLKMHGYANVEDINAISSFHGLRKSRALQDTFLPLAADSAMPSLDKAEAFGERFRRGRVGQQRLAEVGSAAADASIGGEEMAAYEAQRRAAFDRMRARKDFAVGGMDYEDTKSSSPFALWADRQIEHEMYLDVNRRRRDVGMGDRLVQPMGPWYMAGHAGMGAVAHQLYGAEQEIAAAGGEAGVNINPLVEMGRRQLELGERQVAALEKIAGGQGSWDGRGGDGGASWAPDSAPPPARAMR